MRVDLKHVQKRGSSYRYRRKVPGHLREAMGKGEIVVSLGASEAEALRRYAKVHAQAERQLDHAKSGGDVAMSAGSLTPLAAHLLIAKRLREMGIDPASGSDPDEIDLREIIADGIEAGYPEDQATGHPVGVSPEDAAMLRMLRSPKVGAPKPTLEDAKRLYLSDKFEREKPGPKQRKREEQRAERIVTHIKSALGRDPVLAELRREDARSVRQHMASTINSPNTVDRYLNDARAIINFAIREFDLNGVGNPFMNLSVGGGSEVEIARRRRNVFTTTQLKQIRLRLAKLSRTPELLLIWRLLEGTGCRLSEVTGLRVSDLHLEGPRPYLNVEWHDDRRIKTDVSRRWVPLLGDAVAAAKEAAKAAGRETMLFPRYSSERGGDAASAALMKHVRAVTDERKLVTHSLRHGIKDRLRSSGASRQIQNLVLGHSTGGAGETYGSDEAQLMDTYAAMESAMTGADK